MTTACIVAAVLVIIAALIAVTADAIEERKWHAANAEQLAAQLATSNARLEQVLNEHAACPAPYHSRGTW